MIKSAGWSWQVLFCQEEELSGKGGNGFMRQAVSHRRWQTGPWGSTLCLSDVWNVKFMRHSGEKTSLFPL